MRVEVIDGGCGLPIAEGGFVDGGSDLFTSGGLVDGGGGLFTSGGLFDGGGGLAVV